MKSDFDNFLATYLAKKHIWGKEPKICLMKLHKRQMFTKAQRETQRKGV